MSLNTAEAAPAETGYLTVRDVATRLRTDRRTVYALIASGQLRTIRITRTKGARGTYRIPVEYFAEYEQSLRTETPADLR